MFKTIEIIPPLSGDLPIPVIYYYGILGVLLGAVFYASTIISPLLIIAIVLLIVITLYVPELALFGFIFSRVLTEWLEEQFPLFTASGYEFLLVIALVAVVCIRLARYRNADLPRYHPYVWPLLLLSILLFIGLTYTPGSGYAVDKAVQFLFFGVFLFIATIMLLQKKSDIVRFVAVFVVMSIAVSGIMIYEGIQSILSGDFLGYFARLTILGANPIGIARVLAIAIASLSVIAFFEKSRTRRFYLFALIMFLFIALLATNTRGPVLSLIAGMVVFILFLSGSKPSKIISYSSLLVAIIIIMFMVLPEQFINRYFLLFGEEYGVYAQIGTEPDTRATRLEMWGQAGSLWLSDIKSFFIGRGTGSFPLLSTMHDFRWYPHNIFLEAVAEFGIIGLLVVLVVLGKMVDVAKSCWTMAGNDEKEKVLLLVILVPIIVSFFAVQMSGDFPSNRLLWMQFGILVAYWRIRTSEMNSQNAGYNRIE